MAGLHKQRVSRSVSPPETAFYGACGWIRRSATSLQFYPGADSKMEADGLSGVGHKTGYVSPLRARTMKEYEQQITELQKENFNLKLRLYFLEEKMDKNFDSDTRQLHEVNVQLKIEAEHLRKELEQKNKLLEDTRASQQRIEEKHEKEFQEWKMQLERKHNLEQKELPKDMNTTQDKTDLDVSLSEICKEAFGIGCCSPSQTDVSESIQSDIEAREKQLVETMTTLQRLDKLQQEELVDLREMAREKQSSLNNYVAKIKQLQEQQQSTAESTGSKSPHSFTEDTLPDDSSSQGSSNVELVSKVKLPELPDLCSVCGNQTKTFLESQIANMKKQTLKRDKIIQGLTETVYKRIKEVEKLKSSLTEKESIELVMTALLKTIEVAIKMPCKYDKVKDALKTLSSFLAKTQTKLKTSSEKKWPDDVIKSLEKHFMQWIISLHRSSENCDGKDAEELHKEQETITDEYRKSMRALLITIRQKDKFLQDLCHRLESVSDLIFKNNNVEELSGSSNSDKKLPKELNRNLIDYKKQVEELETTTKNLLHENSELKAMSKEMKRNYDNTINQKDVELNKNLSLYKEAMEDVKRFQQDLNDKEDHLIKCKEEISDMTEKYHFLQQRSALDAADQEKQERLLNERLENAYRAYDEMKEAYKELDVRFHNAVQEKDQQIDISNKRYKELQNEYVRVQSSLSEKTNVCLQLRNELDSLAQKFSVIHQEKLFQDAEIDKLKLQLENCKMASLESKEIQYLKDLVQEKTLMAEGLIVELQLKDSMTKQLIDELEASKAFSGTKQVHLNKTIAEKDIPNICNIKRHSLPVSLHSADKLGMSALKYSKLMSQRLSSFGHSDNIFELKEEIYFLVLKIEKLEQQIRDYDEGIGSKLSLLSGFSGIFQDSSMNRTTKTWHVLHTHIEELADFLEGLLRLDSDGQLDTSLLTPKNLARLKQYLLDSKELSQSLSASLLGNETTAMDGMLDIEPSKDVGSRIKECLYTEKIIEERTGVELGKQQNFEQAGILNNLNSHNLGMAEPEWFQYISSDSDIWSEPDRAVSIQRMGLNISMQARMSHSPQKITSPRCDADKNSAENMTKDRKVKKSARPDSNEHLKTQVAECHAALQDKVEECHNLIQSKEVLEKELSECQDELASCREMLETLQTQLEEKDREYQKLLKEKHQLEEEEKANHRSHEETHRKLVALNDRFESMQLRLSEEENKVLAISTERSHLVHQLENKVRENRQIQDWNLRLQKELEDKESICQQYQETKTKLQCFEENSAKLKVELTEQCTLRNNLTNEIAMLKKEVNCKEKKLKEVMQFAQKLEEAAEEKNILHENETTENLKRISELEGMKNELQNHLEQMGKKLLETEKSLHAEYQAQNNAKEELLNELMQLKKELAQNVNANKKLRHRLEKPHKQEHMQAVKDVGMSCTKGDESHITSTEINPAIPAATTGFYPLIKAKDFDNTLLVQNYKAKWKSCENIGNKINDSLHMIKLDKSLSENSNEKFSHFSSAKGSDRSRQMSGSTEDSRGQRSQYTSPDLGIESDPAHEFEATDVARTNTDVPESEIAKENFDTSNVPSFAQVEQYQKRKSSDVPLLSKSQDHARQDLSSQWLDQMLFAVCQLQDYELLKKEIEEGLILVKGIQARIKERILALSSKTSPIKSLEYSTLKELNHSCSNIELYLGKGCHLIGGFWTAPLSTKYMQSFMKEKDLVKENLLLSAELAAARNHLAMQTKELKEAREKINAAHIRKEKMERAISNQLVKTRQVLKEAKGNLVESRKHKRSNDVGIKTQHPAAKEGCQVPN